jgi:hypothetical protein
VFTLHFPVRLPNEHTFFDNGQYPVPPLPGGLSIRCLAHENAPLVLKIAGFATEQAALDYCPALAVALRMASLDCKHSMAPSDATPVVSLKELFDGSVPTVTSTKIDAQPYFMSASMQKGLHISVLSRALIDVLVHVVAKDTAPTPGFHLSLELFSDCQFVGERNAQFIVLMTALEVLVPNTTRKRGPVIALVKNALSKVGRTDAKAMGKALDQLYVLRNELLHEGKAITHAELETLRQIVQLTLKALCGLAS